MSPVADYITQVSLSLTGGWMDQSWISVMNDTFCNRRSSKLDRWRRAGNTGVQLQIDVMSCALLKSIRGCVQPLADRLVNTFN